MKKLIISADDLGLTKSINQAIFSAHRDGLLTSASILANGDYFEDAARLFKNVNSISIGVHINLIRGRPVAKISSLCVPGEEKFFNNTKLFIYRYCLRRIKYEDLYSEVFAQVEKVYNFGIKISHLDTEQYIHRIPSILKVVLAVARRFGVNKLRFSESFLYLPDNREFLPFLCLEKILLFRNLNKKYLTRAGLRYPDSIICLNLMREINNLCLAEIFNQIENGITELVTHPLLSISDYPDPRDWGRFRRKAFPFNDYLFLMSQEAKRIIKDKDIKLINYWQV